eukprot:TRINITY_DN3985_c3_g1_i1.p2 TRINITY_DN3985_c3_g1~~TRINITY_DN3985_c3_g1_i1.p2  ORF type:complete len:631 (-),score=82.57 TRINITY_DN3985_c3_g1_i1:7082-8974(-)
MKRKIFGEATEITEEELKQFDEEYGKCKDTIIRTLSTIKTELIQDSLNGTKQSLPQVSLKPPPMLESIGFDLTGENEDSENENENEEIPEEICGEDDAKPQVKIIELPAASPAFDKSELTSFLTPTGPSVTSHESVESKPLRDPRLPISPERMLNLKKQEQLEQLRRSTLNTALYKSRSIHEPGSKPPLHRAKKEILEDSIADPQDDSLDEGHPEDKKEEDVDHKTESIIKALDSHYIQMKGTKAQEDSAENEDDVVNTLKQEEEKTLKIEVDSVFSRAENNDTMLMKGTIVENELEKNVEVDTTHIEIVGYLGSGGEGKVYLGRITSLNEYVALKQFEVKIDQKEGKKLFDMIAKEVELVKTLNHPNIIKYYKLHRSNFRNLQNVVEYNVIMEYMNNGSLVDLLKIHKRGLPKPQIQEIIRQVLSGLQYLHSHNIIHRDLKPANILTSKSGNCYKITDFGISTQVKEKMTNIKRTCAGTPWYMAPEVILDKPYSYAADIWSLGCLCFELFCGKRPYANFGGMQAMFQMVQHISPLESCSPNVKHLFSLPENAKLLDFISQCWRCNPIDRPKAGKLLQHPFVRKRTAAKKKKGKKAKKGTNKTKKKEAKVVHVNNKVQLLNYWQVTVTTQ